MIFQFDHATVDGIHDGDTFYALIDMGVRVFTRQKIRMRGVHAIELGDPPTKEGAAARSLLETLLPLGMPLRLISHRWSYDRLECEVIRPSDGFDMCAAQTNRLRSAGLEGGN